MMFDLTRPGCVDDDEWQALSALDERLSRALRDHDAELMLGTAKELCEAVAKVTCQQRGEPFTPLADMPELIKQAHRLIDRLPAAGGAAGSAVRNVAQTAMTLAKQLNELRNQAGSGHGRPTPTGLDEIDGRFAASSALIWCRWMLGRLDALVANDPDRLVSDISQQVFTRGDLERRLAEAGLPAMEPLDQFAVGFAVGQRGGPGGTFNVHGEGVRPPAQSPDLATWPQEYRRGVAKGLMTDRNGYIVVGSRTLDDMIAVLTPIPPAERAAVVTELRDAIAESEFAYAVDDEDRIAAAAIASRAAQDATGDLAAAFDALATEISVPDEPR
jgi:hypothetical protein